LRCAEVGSFHASFFQNSSSQPLADQLQDYPVADAHLHQLHELLLIDVVEVALDVDVDHPIAFAVTCFSDAFKSLFGTPSRSKSKG
jgi:hypothetical protein